MPELPEVKYLSNYILEKCKNHTLKNISILRGRYHKHGPPKYYSELISSLPLKLEDVRQKGKVMVLCFDKDWFIVSKLGLTGWWYIDDNKPTWMKTEPNVAFKFETFTLYYIDLLSYGTLTFTTSHTEIDKEFAVIAPDYMNITIEEIQQRLNKKYSLLDKQIEEVIIDQKAIVSGIGNYMKAEILYDVGISPLRLIKSITVEEWKNIIKSARKITNRMKKYIGAEEQYVNSMKVYMKDVDPEGNTVIKHKTNHGRTTYWVAEKQH